MDRVGMEENVPIEAKIVTRGIENAQKSVEGRNFGIRKNVLKYDDVMNKQREVIYGQRRQVLDGEDVSGIIRQYIQAVIDNSVDGALAAESESGEGEMRSLESELAEIFGIAIPLGAGLSGEELKKNAFEAALARYSEREKGFGAEEMRKYERLILLRIVDNSWMEHIDNMDQLRQGISLHAYGHTDPVQAYTKEGLDMFEGMTETIIAETVKNLFHFEVREESTLPKEKMKPPAMSTNRDAPAQKIRREGQIAKNAPCPCGSGKKYKRCCGKDIA